MRQGRQIGRGDYCHVGRMLKVLCFVVMFAARGVCSFPARQQLSALGTTIRLSPRGISTSRSGSYLAQIQCWSSTPEGAASAYGAVEKMISSPLFLDKMDRIVIPWFDELSEVKRSPPYWVGSDILTLSPSRIAQRGLDFLLGPNHSRAPLLFSTDGEKNEFDDAWRKALLASFPHEILESILSDGTSNTHPLRLQVIAVPSGYDFSLHGHPGIEMNIVLAGEMNERCQQQRRGAATVGRGEGDTALPAETLRRRPEHRVEGPGGFSRRPSPEELKAVGDDLSLRAIVEDCGERGSFSSRTTRQGCVLVNDIGSVHQTYTLPGRGCLFLGLGSNLHAHFLPGNFQQRTGIGSLKGIEHLMGDLAP